MHNYIEKKLNFENIPEEFKAVLATGYELFKDNVKYHKE